MENLFSSLNSDITSGKVISNKTITSYTRSMINNKLKKKTHANSLYISLFVHSFYFFYILFSPKIILSEYNSDVYYDLL